jgi:2-polyprenyl-3-methyl-5-hydroxy-6-metoxy-1,4-benzoquinol methylase
VSTHFKSPPGLRAYLERTGFANLYRYIVSSRTFHNTPLVLNATNQEKVLAVANYLSGELHGRRLLFTLMVLAPVSLDDLNPEELDLCKLLVADGLLHEHEGRYHNAGRQLVCVESLYLFIDGALGFPTVGGFHEVYIGADSASLLYYLGGIGVASGSRALDLCSGTGVIGLAAAARGARAVLTDVSEPALRLAALNRELNRLDETVEIVREDVHETIGRDETWDLITCNPPFIAAPPEIALPSFARGPGPDGLGILRDILRSLPARLAPGGNALFVADLLGDHKHAFFTDELADLGHDLTVEVYIDQRRSAGGHAEALARVAVRVDPSRSLDDTMARMRAFVADDLGASQIYLSVIRVRHGPPGLFVCNRWLGLAPTSDAQGSSL